MKISTLIAVVLTGVVAGSAGYWAALHLPRGHAPVEAGGTRKVAFYQSPMHPWIKSDKPGKCTICGMDLVPVYEGEKGIEASGNLIALGSATASVTGVKAIPARRGPLVRSLRVTGILDDDDTRHRFVSVYSRARIEKLFVNQVGQEFAAGDIVGQIYSPELLQAKQEFHALARGTVAAATAQPLLAAARERLSRLGMTDGQIERLAKEDAVPRETDLIAPIGGVVLERNAYEGNYVESGAPILTIADLSKLWFIFDAYEADLGWLRVGQNVEITTPSRPGETFTAPITFIDPNLKEATRTARVRVVVDNTDRKLLHRQTATGMVVLDTPDVILIPRSAVVFTQAAPLVYVDRGGAAYEPRAVKLGRSGDADYEVLSGVQPGERVVSEGALLLDGQAQLSHLAGGSLPPNQPAPRTASSSDSIPPAAAESSDISALKPLVLAAADAADALAADNFSAYEKVRPAIHSAFAGYTRQVPDAAKGPLAKLVAALDAGKDLKSSRQSFEVFSTAVADLARDAHLHHAGLVSIYECPMAPVLGKGRWVQRSGDLKNPFYGSAMLECGLEVK